MEEQGSSGLDLVRLRELFEKLSEEQLRAMQAATYVGMTPEEAKVYDERRRKITELAKRLALLQRLHTN